MPTLFPGWEVFRKHPAFFISRKEGLASLVTRSMFLFEPHAQPYLLAFIPQLWPWAVGDRNLLKTSFSQKETHRLRYLENPGMDFKHSWNQELQQCRQDQPYLSFAYLLSFLHMADQWP